MNTPPQKQSEIIYPCEAFRTKHWHKLEDDKIQCDICPRYCKMREGQRGLCFVRGCLNGEIVLSTYGRSSGFCIDPIEKKPLNHFLPGSTILSFGTAGCNLTCKFCQNWHISKSRHMDKLLAHASPSQIAKHAQSSKCKSVAFTYNDPVVFFEYAIDSAQACHQLGIRTVAVTAGYISPEPRKEFFSYMDAANVDLKGFSESFYHSLCSASLKPVLETLVYIKEHTSVWLEITVLLIPGKNDSRTEISAMCAWIAQNLGHTTPLHFTAFHPNYRMQNIQATPLSTLVQARQIALEAGLHYVYTGNILNKTGSTTFCHTCNHAVIVRNGYEIEFYDLDYQGCCPKCRTKCHGVFSRRILQDNL